jgi:hypothetical protein
VSDERRALSGASALYPANDQPAELHRASISQARQIEAEFHARVSMHNRLKHLEEWKPQMEARNAKVEERATAIETTNTVNAAVNKRTMAIMLGLFSLINAAIMIIVDVLMHTH